MELSALQYVGWRKRPAASWELGAAEVARETPNMIFLPKTAAAAGLPAANWAYVCRYVLTYYLPAPLNIRRQVSRGSADLV
jgi:hypothetical protein